MKIKLDENLPLRLAGMLMALGYDREWFSGQMAVR
jgi:hypothetical protein